jgi:hypothetical protein
MHPGLVQFDDPVPYLIDIVLRHTNQLRVDFLFLINGDY